MPGVGSLRWACTFHALGDANLTRRQPVFWWNMGFTVQNTYPYRQTENLSGRAIAPKTERGTISNVTCPHPHPPSDVRPYSPYFGAILKKTFVSCPAGVHNCGQSGGRNIYFFNIFYSLYRNIVDNVEKKKNLENVKKEKS